MLTPYRNEAFMDFSSPDNLQAIQQALEQVKQLKQKNFPLIIGSELITTEKKIVSYNPSQKTEIVGQTSCADQQHADMAVAAAGAAFSSWSRISIKERAFLLLKAAAIMRRRKFFLSALLVEEVGKNYAEADGDVCEAIDFLEYYARQMLLLQNGMPVYSSPEEINETAYLPLGVGLIISPWNFPLAILTGMTAAALVTGNTVIVKPASTAPLIAAEMVAIFAAAGAPDGVINFLPGPGDRVGNYLVGHPGIRFINFTGSKEVGINIYEIAAKVMPGQRWLKRVVMELGGKDAIIVDSECDLEQAAAAIITSAFGYQGQKCSACSRAIIVAEVYDRMVELIAAKARQLKVGSACEPDTDLGPVIDQRAYASIRRFIDIGHSEGRLVCGEQPVPDKGYFIAPTVFADVAPDAVIATQEIFGPVLALIKADSFDHALEIANSSDYGLTGAVFSDNRFKLAQARANFHVGNLYLNRKCTGALVGVQPFGGFGLSGTDSKAGGADYLLHFLQAKTITEKL